MMRQQVQQAGDFLFSFVIPAYNVEPYLAGAVESVIAQTVGFEENIQIVLVNDGSADGTGAVCKRYRDSHPDNIVYVEKPNGGASSARNAGLRAAAGRYVNFLDADDKWDPDACRAALDFFEKHPQVNIVCFPIMFFDRVEHAHWLNYRFGQTRVADILKDTDYALYHLPTCFIRSNIAGARSFHEGVSISEDMAWLGRLLLDERHFGVIAEPHYRYRKRFDSSSAIDTRLGNLSYYLVTPHRCFLNILHYAQEKYGQILPWAQYEVMLDLTWRLKEEDTGFLAPTQKEEYRGLLRDCLARIDDRIICSVRNLRPEERMCALALKYGMSYEQVKAWVAPDEQTQALRFCRPGAEPVPFGRPWFLLAEFVDIANGRLSLRGSCFAPVPGERMALALEIEFPDGNRHEHPCALFRRPDQRKRFFFEDGLWAFESFELSLPLADGIRIRSFLTIDGLRFGLKWLHDKLSPFIRGNAASYLARAGHIVGKLPDDKGLFVEALTSRRVQERERAFLVEILREPEHPPLTWIARLRQAGRRRRAARTDGRRAFGRRVWLYHDCPGVEKGDAYYQFLHDIRIDDGITRYYVVHDDMATKRRLFTPRQMRRVIPFNGIRHQLLFLAAEQIVAACMETTNWMPFDAKTRQYYTDLFHARVVCLQHGVQHAHLPEKYSFGCLRADLTVVSTHFERRNLCENYGFDEAHLIPSGMPRYDFMNCDARPRRKILFAPSWRRYLVFPKKEGRWSGIPDVFVRSRFYTEINRFLRSRQLLALLEESDHALELKLHPILAGLYRECFHFDHPRIQMASDTVHEDEYSILITDFSSYRFDFVYLKRAVLYFFPDEDLFKAGRCSYRETDLPLEGMFGDMARTADEAAALLERVIANGGRPEDKYAKQMDGFFLHYDNKQRERIYRRLVTVNAG